VSKRKPGEQVSIMEGDLLTLEFSWRLERPEIEWTLELLDLQLILTLLP